MAKKFDIKIENIVACTALGIKIPLETLVNHLEGTEYEPEQFPGLVYRMRDPKVAFLLFSSGKIIITGGRRVEDIEVAVKELSKKLKNI